MGRLTLVVGGQKSGKSSTAARLATATGAPVIVVAPAVDSDDEMTERIARHRRDRPPEWMVLERFDLVAALGEADDSSCVIIDALDTWLAHAMGEAGLWTGQEVEALGPEGSAAQEKVLAQVDALAAAAAARTGETIVVAGQPGLGLHALGAGSRRYVDLHGLASQRLGRAGRVLLVVAGRAIDPQAIDPEAPPVPEAIDPGAPPVSRPLATARADEGVPQSRDIELAALVQRVVPVDEQARAAAVRRHDALAKPPGSLGGLEDLGARLAAIAGSCPPPVPAAPGLLLAAGDHGVHAEGVTAWPQEVTAAIVRAACRGQAVSATLARASGVRLAVLDAGLAHDPGEHPLLVRGAASEGAAGEGTANLRRGDAMTVERAHAAISAGAATAGALLDEGVDLLLVGDMGIANTTASACLVAALTGAPAATVTGRGAGADDAMLGRKVEIVDEVVRRTRGRTPLEMLAAVGGFEHAALLGAMLAAAGRRVPVVLDGVVTNAAALVAVALAPALSGYLVAAHRSAEPGAAAALEALGLRPLLDLDLRLGEGSGALLAAPLVRSAAVVLAETALLSEL